MGVSVLAAPLAVAKDLRTIQAQGKLTIAVKDNLPPLGFLAEGGQLQGLEIEIARRLAQELLGKTDGLVLKPVLNQDRLSAVINGQVDLVIAKVTATPLRERVVAFSIPYYNDGTALITKDRTIQQLTDLAGRAIVVLNNSSTIEIIRNRLPNARLIGAISYQAAQDALERGEASAFAADASVLSGWVQQNPSYRMLTPTLSVEPLCIVLPKGVQYAELRQRINELLARWQAEGWLKARIVHWGLP